MTDDCKIYVGSLSCKTDNKGLARHFQEIGEVTEATVIYERDTGRSRGFGFVTFSDPSCVDRAIDKLNDTDLDGRKIKVSKANSRTGGGGGGFSGRGGPTGGGFGGRGAGYGRRYQGGGGGGDGGGSYGCDSSRGGGYFYNSWNSDGTGGYGGYDGGYGQ